MPPVKKSNATELAPKFIVKKRLYEGDGGHHGGVWKIAYADFMTAMMAFFLVMWLINTASKEKITKLANYFNPVKLTDRNPGKGVRDNEAGGVGEAKTAPSKPEQNLEKPVKKIEAGKKHESDKKPDSDKHQGEDEALFSNPFGVLTRLASQAEGSMAIALAQGQPVSANAGGASHDPFATDPIVSEPLGNIAAPAPWLLRAAYHDEANAPPRQVEDRRADGKAAKKTGDQQPSEKTQETAAQLGEELTRLMEQLPRSFRPNITTKATSEGVLVSLTDDLNFSMFRIASAEPSPQLVLVLERIGALINRHPGKLVVRGHTDGRQYADAHGNWRLSVNRANMTYFMLLRAKVDDGRFLAVEGYADRNLRNKADRLAAENRRIEILIKSVES